jgi:uracil-DNA glycosylase
MSLDQFLIDLNSELVDCRLCPRLVEWREEAAQNPPKRYAGEAYWARPMPIFGDPEARRLIVGLAPAAHGGNRTGRIFTGDRSGDWLFRALHKAGLANQPTSEHLGDGLRVERILIAAAAHCAPPANRPTPEEVRTCSRYLGALLASRRWASFLCLGGLAWDHLHRMLDLPRRPFGHLATTETPDGALIVGSYHVSQQNTFTGRLTEPMLDEAICRFRDWPGRSDED